MQMGMGLMSLKELEYRIEKKLPMRLIDLRSPEEYGLGHLEGAENIPYDCMAERIGELEGERQPVIFYCHRGGHSLQAARIAAARGIPAFSVANGIAYYRGRHMVRN